MKTNTLAAVSLLLGSFSALAVETNPIVVTATRTAQTVDETLASVTVLSRQDIEKQQAQSVQDLLRNVAGIDIGNNGGSGKSTSIFIRGTESDHVLVLIDGIKVGSATLGTTAFEHIPVEQIERIEIVRGPRSSLYGSEAIGGVIQIFTRKQQASPYITIGGGSYDSFFSSVGLSRNNKHGWISLNVAGQDTNGFNSCKGSLSAACFAVEPDKDGYHSRSGNLRAGYQFANGLEVSAHALHADADSQFDGFENEGKTIQQVLGGTLSFSPMDIWQFSLIAGRSKDKANNFTNGVFSSRFNTERDTFSWQNNLTIDENHLVSLGIDHQNDSINSTTAYEATSRNDTGFFAQYQGVYANNDILLSLRQEDNSQFGGHTTSNAAWGTTLAFDLRVSASYGTAFKAPTFNELYFPNFGNANLNPEESRSTELAISQKIKPHTHWSINLYETRIDNLIAFDANLFIPANIRQARIRGIEATFDTRLAGWMLQSQLTLTDPKDRSHGINDGKVLPRRAQQSLHLTADHQFGKITFGGSLLAKGRRYDNLANSVRLNGYTTIDLRAEYRLDKDWRLQTRIENLLDQDYETAALYNQAGRSLYITLRYQP